MKSFVLSFVFLISLSLISCSDSDDGVCNLPHIGDDGVCNLPHTNNSTLADLYPFLKLGNEKVYQVYDPYDGLTYFESYTIVGKTTYETSDMTAEAFHCYVNDDTDYFSPYGYVYYDSSFSLGDDFRNGTLPLYKHNGSVGTTWNYTSPYSADNTTYTRTIVSIAESVTVPAGTFNNCILIRHSESTSNEITDYWFRKDIGVIKIAFSTGDLWELYSKNY